MFLSANALVTRSGGPQEHLRTGPGATDNAGKVIPARGVMVPLLFEVAGRIRPPLERLAGVLQSKLVPPVSGPTKKNKKYFTSRYLQQLVATKGAVLAVATNN